MTNLQKKKICIGFIIGGLVIIISALFIRIPWLSMAGLLAYFPGFVGMMYFDSKHSNDQYNLMIKEMNKASRRERVKMKPRKKKETMNFEKIQLQDFLENGL